MRKKDGSKFNFNGTSAGMCESGATAVADLGGVRGGANAPPFGG